MGDLTLVFRSFPVLLTTPQTIRTLQRKLYTKAKQETAYRFYALYDKVRREPVLYSTSCPARDEVGTVIGRLTFDPCGGRRFVAAGHFSCIESTYSPMSTGVRRY